MTADDLGPAVKLAQSGDAEAFITIVSKLQRDIRVLVATYGTSPSMVDYTFCKIWSHCRAQIDQCPASPVAPSWFRMIACLHLQRRLESDLEMARLQADELHLIVIQAALTDFKGTVSPSNAKGLQVLEKFSKIDSETRLLLEQRYGQDIRLPTKIVPGQANLTSTSAAIALFLARDRLDWLTTQQVTLAGVDGQFAILIDEYLQGQLSPASFNRLVTLVTQDNLRGVQLGRQMRLHLVLTSLLSAAGTDQARILVGSLDSISVTTTELEKIALPDNDSNRHESFRGAKRSSGMHHSIGSTRGRFQSRSPRTLPIVIGAVTLIAVVLALERAPSSTDRAPPVPIGLNPSADPSRETDLATSQKPATTFPIPTPVPAPNPTPSALSGPSGPNGVTSIPSAIIAIGCGGSGVGTFGKDKYFHGGQGHNDDPSIHVRTAGIADAAPEAVYQTERWGDILSYIIPDLSPGASYSVRLHFSECYFIDIGKRIFSVSINGTQALANFDILAAAGGARIAIVRNFTTIASNRGEITISFTQIIDHPKINGLEIISLSTLPDIKREMVRTVLAPGNPIEALSATHVGGLSHVYQSTNGEDATNILDGNLNTKCFIDGLENGVAGTGFIVTAGTSDLVTAFQFATANDCNGRDPLEISIEGTAQNHDDGPWTLIYSGSSGLMTDPGRNQWGKPMVFPNVTAFQTYRVLITSVRDKKMSASQYSEFRLGTIVSHVTRTPSP